ncbi:MAG: anthranilate phosphoribosyltransferase [Candidatus Dormibacteraeota bacterium]|nr:anthranilate phosphoribosyltransferase [Candidatus Dormibacteraeota bacterium]
MRDVLERVVSGDDLSTDEARSVMDRMMDGAVAPAVIGAFLAALRTKGETVDELTGMVLSMREHAVRIDVPDVAVDTCGTGGDAMSTFNISTAAALVAAGAGCIVAKHGNRAASSRCGSADVLEALGVNVDLPPDAVLRCIHASGIGFLYAPSYHPAMRHVSPTRRELGIRTAFNLLGPMANPARVRRQALGVPDSTTGRRMAQVLLRLGHERALVFTGDGGVDELTVNGAAVCHDVQGGHVTTYDIHPAVLGLPAAPVAALHGGDAETNAARIRSVLGGEPGAARDTVTLNAAAALVAAGVVNNMPEGLGRAAEAIDSGAALASLERLVTASQRAA